MCVCVVGVPVGVVWLYVCACAHAFREGHGGLDHGAVVRGQQDAWSDHPAPQEPPPHQQCQGHQEKTTVSKRIFRPVYSYDLGIFWMPKFSAYWNRKKKKKSRHALWCICFLAGSFCFTLEHLGWHSTDFHTLTVLLDFFQHHEGSMDREWREWADATVWRLQRCWKPRWVHRSATF